MTTFLRVSPTVLYSFFEGILFLGVLNIFTLSFILGARGFPIKEGVVFSLFSKDVIFIFSLTLKLTMSQEKS
jgi:hypothetical protein